MGSVWRKERWWTLGGVVVACAGAALIARNAIEARRAAFETDARIVHRLLSQQAVQHDAILDTLALLQPMAGTADPRPPSCACQPSTPTSSTYSGASAIRHGPTPH